MRNSQSKGPRDGATRFERQLGQVRGTTNDSWFVGGKRIDDERADPVARDISMEYNWCAMRTVRFFATVLIAVLAARSGMAQLNTGSISGQVTDPNGAVVPRSTVQLVDQETGFRRSAAANEAGFYTFPLTPVGSYQLTVEAPGFKKYVQSNIALQVNQNLTVAVRLQLGEVSETIEVTSAPLQVDTVSSSVKEVVDRTRISELPLNGRNVLQLQQLVSGAIYAGSGDQFGNTPAFQVNGGVSFSNNYTLDGGEHSDSFFNSAITFPNPDAIEEFSIQTSSYSAEYGRNRGATVNAVTRAGTNAYHGSLFEFVRNDVFDARDFFSPKKPPFKRNQYGATLGAG